MMADVMIVITHNAVDLTEEAAGKAVCVAGMITDVRAVTTKETTRWHSAALEDLTGSVVSPFSAALP